MNFCVQTVLLQEGMGLCCEEEGLQTFIGSRRLLFFSKPEPFPFFFRGIHRTYFLVRNNEFLFHVYLA